MNVLTTNGIVLHFADEGPADGPVLVFSNSLGTDFRIWDRVVSRLPGGLRILRYDKRGHGLSSCPDAPYQIEDHARDLIGLLDQLRVKEAVVVGLSVGGLIAQAVASMRGDLVKGLVLADTAHKIGTNQMWQTRIDAVTAGGIPAMADAILERWFSTTFRRERPDELEIWRAMLSRTPKEGYLGTCMAIRDADLTEVAKNLKVPAICLVGTEDGSTPPDLMRSTAGLMGTELVEIEGVGHLPCIEAPNETTTVITEFLTRLEIG